VDREVTESRREGRILGLGDRERVDLCDRALRADLTGDVRRKESDVSQPSKTASMVVDATGEPAAGDAVVQAFASVTPGAPRSWSPVRRLANTNGMVPAASMVTWPRHVEMAELKTTLASYPAAVVLSSFSWNAQTPRSTSATQLRMAAGHSRGRRRSAYPRWSYLRRPVGCRRPTWRCTQSRRTGPT